MHRRLNGMSKPHWEKLHDGWVSDFKFWVEQKSFFVEMARKHPGEKRWHEVIKGLEKLISREQKRYKEIYGVRFNINRVRSGRD